MAPSTDPMVLLSPTTTPPLVIGPQQGVVGAGAANNVAFWQTSTTLTDSAGVTKPANQGLMGPTSGAAAAPAFRTLVAADMPASVLINPMTTIQDLIVGGAAGAPARLGVGSNTQVLSVVSGAVAWAAPANPLTTTQDILVGGAAGAQARLAVGTNGQALEVEGGLLVWQAVLKSLGTQTVGVAQVTVAHGLGRVPTICIAQMTSAGTIWRSAASDGTNVYLTADAAARTCELYVR